MFKNALNFDLFRLFFVIYWLYIQLQCKEIQTCKKCKEISIYTVTDQMIMESI